MDVAQRKRAIRMKMRVRSCVGTAGKVTNHPGFNAAECQGARTGFPDELSAPPRQRDKLRQRNVTAYRPGNFAARMRRCTVTQAGFPEGMMRRRTAVVSLFSLATLIALSTRADAQTAAAASRHVLVIKMALKSGAVPYVFEPATTYAQPGDTLRFVEASGVLHNVRFTKQAPGARLGSAATTPYLTQKGQSYDLVVDHRFAPGTYEFVCDPHAAIGMKGTLIVK